MQGGVTGELAALQKRLEAQKTRLEEEARASAERRDHWARRHGSPPSPIGNDRDLQTLDNELRESLLNLRPRYESFAVNPHSPHRAPRQTTVKLPQGLSHIHQSSPENATHVPHVPIKLEALADVESLGTESLDAFRSSVSVQQATYEKSRRAGRNVYLNYLRSLPPSQPDTTTHLQQPHTRHPNPDLRTSLYDV